MSGVVESSISVDEYALADTVVKIGLGAFIGAIFGYIGLKSNQKHENSKLKKERFYQQQQEKKQVYIEFLAQSESLIQQHIYNTTTPDTLVCRELTRSHINVTLISEENLKVIADETLHAVLKFASLRNQDEFSGLLNQARGAMNKLHAAAKLELSKSDD